MKPRHWFALLLLRVCISVFLIQSAHVPDEYWQSVEVAYHQIYGKGDLTWEWTTHLRGALHAQIFTLLFYVLHMVGADTMTAMWVAPRVLQGVATFVIDIGCYQVARVLYRSETVARTALTLIVASWCQTYLGSRTLVNTLEALLTTWAMYYYLKCCGFGDEKKKRLGREDMTDFSIFLTLVGIGAIARITSIIMWVPCLPVLVFRSWKHFLCTALIASLSLVVLVLVDYTFYREWVFTPWAFFCFNFLEGHSALFGTHPWHWYFSQALPAMAGVAYPLFIVEAWHYPRNPIIPLVIFFVVAFSFVKHKEFRFLYPVIPIMHVVVANYLQGSAAGPSAGAKRERRVFPSYWRRAAYCLLVASNIVVMLFLCLVHQTGMLSALHYLRSDQCNKVQTLDYWTGCHEAPGYSYVHGCVANIRTFDCPVVLNGTARLPTPHTSFQQFPTEYVRWVYEGTVPQNETAREMFAVASPPHSRPRFPSHILLYDTHFSDALLEYLADRNYRVEKIFFHTFFPIDESVGRHVYLVTLST